MKTNLTRMTRTRPSASSEQDTDAYESLSHTPIPARRTARRIPAQRKATVRPQPGYPPLYEDEDRAQHPLTPRSHMLRSRPANASLSPRRIRGHSHGLRFLRHVHPMLLLGIGLMLILLGWILAMQACAWTTARLNDLRYGNPRTYQTDAVVGHHDSAAHPSHFIVENWHSHVIVIEFPAGNPTKAIVYTGPILLGEGQEETPVTVTFDDVAHNGRPEMILHIQGTQVIFTNGPDNLFHLATPQQ